MTRKTMTGHPLVVVAGPTATGKSALAMRLAEAFDGVVINADALQVYAELAILTARPSAADEARVPHRLYGVLPAAEACSAGRWRGLAVEACQAAWAEGRLPVVAGGTGLYLKSLLGGLSPIPDIPDDIRAETRALFARLGNEAFHRALAERDPVMAARLDPGNSQRLMRAWEVLAATGRSLAAWQAEPARDPLPGRAWTVVLEPPREALYAACDRRFLAMIDRGAVGEVRRLLDLQLDPGLPVLKAVGVPELAAHLAGRTSLEEAIAAAQQATRNYAKRQLTWFRHQLSAELRLPAQFSESFVARIFPVIREFLLTTAR